MEFEFRNVVITSLIELGKYIYKYPRFFFNKFKDEDFLKMIYEKDYEVYENIMMLKNNSANDDVFLFKVQYALNKYLPLATHTMIFKSYRELGERIIRFGPQRDVYLMELLQEKLLSYYFRLQGDDIKKKKLYAEVCALEKLAETDLNFAYFKLGFTLTSSKVIIYEGNIYKTPVEFLTAMCLNYNLFDWSRKFEESRYAFSWFSYLGYDTLIGRYENLISLVDKKEDLLNE